MADQEKWTRFRIAAVAALFVLLWLTVVVHAFRIQVSGQQQWQERAERQHSRMLPIHPQRGAIYDNRGQALAQSLEVDSVYAVPKRIEDPKGAAAALAPVLGLDAVELSRKLSRGNAFVWLKRLVSPRESAAVSALGIEGIDFIKEHRRFYPNAGIGAQVIGFTGLDPVGLEGLELEFDARMQGQKGHILSEKDALGRGMLGDEVQVYGGRPGHSLYLSLDRDLQYILEKELAAGVRESGSRSGTAVMMEPSTGRVLAMASSPGFNPNSPGDFGAALRRNRAVVDAHEPGSTFKIFLMAAALDADVIRSSQSFDCENGRYVVSGKTIRDHKPYGRLSVPEILKYSSNIGTAKIGQKLERRRYYDYLRNFGFGERTGVELPGESKGVMRPPQRWFDLDLATISFGQGISVTPLQLVSATSAIANGGRLMQPYLVERVVDGDGVLVEQVSPRQLRQVVSKKVADKVTEMMIQVTEEGGTGTLSRVPGHRVAGKTGTAQKVDPVAGGYSMDKRIGSFVGFVPADDPRLCLLVLMDEPKDGAYGGLVAAPVFSRIATQSLQHLGVAPTDKSSRRRVEPLDEVPPLEDPVAANIRQADGARMPDFRGLSYRQVLGAMKKTGLNIRLEGSGRAVAQNPAAGGTVGARDQVWVRFAQVQ